MNRRTRKMLREYYRAPEPRRKREFAARWTRRRISIGKMILHQLRYISKWHMLCSMLLFGMMLAAGSYVSFSVLGTLYAMVPFLVVLSVTESMRSFRFGMTELESTTLFSLKSIIMMRMLLLGVGNLFCLFMFAFLRNENVVMEFIYLLVPYFLTAAGGLAVFRRHSGVTGNYMCLALSAGVSALQCYVYYAYHDIYLAEYNTIWLFVCILLAVLLGREMKQTFLVITKQREDLVWD